jgi:hypothetical protein
MRVYTVQAFNDHYSIGLEIRTNSEPAARMAFQRYLEYETNWIDRVPSDYTFNKIKWYDDDPRMVENIIYKLNKVGIRDI